MAELEENLGGITPPPPPQDSHWVRDQRFQKLEAARALAQQNHENSQRLQEECQKVAQRLEELISLESQLLKQIAQRVKENPALVREKSWVGIDVNSTEIIDENELSTEEGSAPESVEAPEGKADTQDANHSAEDGICPDEDSNSRPLDDIWGEHVDSDHINNHSSMENSEGKENEDPVASLQKLKHELAQIQATLSREKTALDEKSQALEQIFHEQESLLHEIEEEEKAIKAFDADETAQQALALEEEMKTLSVEIDRLERLCQADSSFLDVSEGEGSLQKEDVVAELVRLQEEKEKLEEQAKEKQAVLDLVGQLSKLRSVDNSDESIMKDLEDDHIIDPPDTGMEHFGQGHHRRSDSLTAKRLDFEAIDFDQFGDQPPDLPLGDDMQESKSDIKVESNGGNEVGERTEVEDERQLLELLVASDSGIQTAPKDVDGDIEFVMPGSEDPGLKNGSPEGLDANPSDKIRCEQGENMPKADNTTSKLPGADEDGTLPSHSELAEPHNADIDPQDVPPMPSDESTFASEENYRPAEVEESSELRGSAGETDGSPGEPQLSGGGDDLGVERKIECDESPVDLQSTKDLDADLSTACETLFVTQSELGIDKRANTEPGMDPYQIVPNRVEELLAEGDLPTTVPVGTSEASLPQDSRLQNEGGVLEGNEGLNISGDLESQISTKDDKSSEPGILGSVSTNITMHESETIAEDFTGKHLPGADEPLGETEEALAKDGSTPSGDRVQKSSDASSGSSVPTRRLKRKMEAKASPTDQEIQKRTKDPDRLTSKQTKKLKDLGNQIDALMAQLEEQTRMREELEHKLEQEHDERLKSEAKLLALSERSPKQDEKLKDLGDQVSTLAVQLEEQTQMREELERKLDQERNERLQSEAKLLVAPSESLPISSMPWAEETNDKFAKLLEEQKELLALQKKEAEKLQNTAEQKVGLLNHQVQDLKVLTNIAGSMENVFSAKDQVLRQALWAAFQALLLFLALLLFVNKFRDSMRNSLRPT